MNSPRSIRLLAAHGHTCVDRHNDTERCRRMHQMCCLSPIGKSRLEDSPRSCPVTALITWEIITARISSELFLRLEIRNHTILLELAMRNRNTTTLCLRLICNRICCAEQLNLQSDHTHVIQSIESPERASEGSSTVPLVEYLRELKKEMTPPLGRPKVGNYRAQHPESLLKGKRNIKFETWDQTELITYLKRNSSKFRGTIVLIKTRGIVITDVNPCNYQNNEEQRINQKDDLTNGVIIFGSTPESCTH